MELSCNLAPYSKYLSLSEALALFADIGFSHVNFDACDCNLKQYVLEEEYTVIQKTLEASPLTLDWFHAPFVIPQPDHHDPEIWSLSLAGLRFMLQRAGDLGARSMVVHPFFETLDMEPDLGPCYERVRDFMGELARYSVRTGCAVALENMPYAEHHELVEFCLDTVPELSFCLDTGHAEICDNWNRWLPKYNHRLSTLHIHDNNGRDDEHVPPGKGVIDWPRFVKRIRESSYQGVWGLEANPFRSATPPDVRAGARQVFEAAQSHLG